ncbi:MAG: DUF1571 domain-containing protein [Bacteroidetes bacterium]|nr:DUF1571 domain-containing protein [Bacteroidota bacterium]
MLLPQRYFKSTFIVVIICTIFILFNSFAQVKNTNPSAAALLKQMNDSIENIKYLRMKIHATERLGKGFNSSHSEIKLQILPRKVYFINPKKKIEILQTPDLPKNKAFVKPNGFPYVTVMLDTYGNLMRKNQHYTINELGFEFISRSILATIYKDKHGINSFKYVGKLLKNGYNCFVVEYESTNFDYFDYTAASHETVTSIAYKLIVNDYLLRYKNNLFNDFDYLKKGTVLKVPNLYCKKAIVCIDEKLMLPISISLFDEFGLLESYDYTEVIKNKSIPDEEFKKEFKGYNF